MKIESKNKLTKKERLVYICISQLIWGCTPVDYDWAVKTSKYDEMLYNINSNILLILDNVMIGFTDSCDESYRTIDIEFNKLAKNEKLLDVLGLVSMCSHEKNAISFFKTYLSAFKNEKYIYDYLTTNPIIRLLTQDVELIAKIEKII